MWNWANFLQQYALCRSLVRDETYMLNCLSSRDGAELTIRPSLWSLIQFRFPIKSAQNSIYVYYISCLSLHHFRIETDRLIIISS